MKRYKLMGWLRGATLVLIIAQAAAHAAVSVYLSPEELSARATLIVEARVIDSRPGVDPASGALHTYVTLAVDRTHRGPGDLAEIVLREPGGRWGDLVHEVDAVPVYRHGERVLAYLEPSRDGTLRTAGMFFGKFRLLEELNAGPLQAARDLEGQGTILGRGELQETLTRNDLVALAASVPQRTRSGAWSALPVEWDRLVWNPERLGATGPGPVPGKAVDLARKTTPAGAPRFAPLNSNNPTRWAQTDNGASVSINIQPAGNPLNDDQAAVAEIGRALDAWTDVPASRLSLTLGNSDYDYTSSNPSPSSNYTGVNVVLFDDPYGDISDPSGCSGVLAIGGYWRSGSTGAPVNGVTFHPALQMYVIFNNDFECFLGNADNLAEVAAHEIGHGLGFGHSTVWDAIMRSSAYGGRGPRLGDDDIDAAHCHYPHTLTLSSPDGGEQWTAGESRQVTWTVSAEAGGDPGTVDLEYSTNGGSTWKPIAGGVANDGSHTWVVPDDPSNDVRVRVLRPQRTNVPAPYPVDQCSSDASAGSLTIAAAAGLAGSVGDGLRLEKAGAMVRLRWTASCSGSADDYAIYEGTLTGLRGGAWDPVPRTCSAGTDLVEEFVPGNGTRYYLVSARSGSSEGSLGMDGAGVPRAVSALACATREPDSTCTP